MAGSKHLEYLLDKNLIAPKQSKILDELYSSGKRPFATESLQISAVCRSTESAGGRETMILHKSDVKRIAQVLEMPELNIELDRAIWQVETALKANEELKQEKTDLQKANQMR